MGSAGAIVGRPSALCALRLTELQPLAQALRRARRATGGAWGDGTGVADRQTLSLPPSLCQGGSAGQPKR